MVQFEKIPVNKIYISKAISDYYKDRKDFKYVRYFNNNILGIILKESKSCMMKRFYNF